LNPWAFIYTNPKRQRGSLAVASSWYQLTADLLNWPRLHSGLADGALLSQFGSTANFTRLFVVLSLAEFLLQSAAFQKFFESPKGRSDGFSVVHTHP